MTSTSCDAYSDIVRVAGTGHFLAWQRHEMSLMGTSKNLLRAQFASGDAHRTFVRLRFSNATYATRDGFSRSPNVIDTMHGSVKVEPQMSSILRTKMPFRRIFYSDIFRVAAVGCILNIDQQSERISWLVDADFPWPPEVLEMATSLQQP